MAVWRKSLTGEILTNFQHFVNISKFPLVRYHMAQKFDVANIDKVNEFPTIR